MLKVCNLEDWMKFWSVEGLEGCDVRDVIWQGMRTASTFGASPRPLAHRQPECCDDLQQLQFAVCISGQYRRHFPQAASYRLP
jgi:hypothetical protein